METKLNKKEIIPAEDLLTKELEDVCGGAATEEASACFSGCIEGAKKNNTADSEEP
mgnify:FL=1